MNGSFVDFCCFILPSCIDNAWKLDFLIFQMPNPSGGTNFDSLIKTSKILTQKFHIKKSRAKILNRLKVCYLRHAKHHAKNHTSQ